MELRALQLKVDEIESLGARIVAISPQVPEKTLETAEKNKVAFEVLSDVGNKVARQFGLVFALSERLRTIYKHFGADLAATNGDELYELPIAATYVIGTKGVIGYAFIDTDYTRRMEPADVVEIVKHLVRR
jgi:peroxiredoxin